MGSLGTYSPRWLRRGGALVVARGDQPSKGGLRNSSAATANRPGSSAIKSTDTQNELEGARGSR